MPVKVLTDHKNLEYFITTKKLTPRQLKWAEFLSEFNFVISYQSGKKNDKADVLTRKSNERPTEDEDKQWQHHMRVLLPPNRINHEAELQPIEEKNDKDHVDQINSDTDSDASDKISLLPEWVVESNWNNELCTEIYLYLANPKELDKSDAYLKSLKMENRLLMKRNWL